MFNIINNISLFQHSHSARKPLALAIGNFDGCHRGHQSLIQQLVNLAKQKGASAGVLTFDPRPEAFFRQFGAETLLFTREQKSRAFEELGVDFHILQEFDFAFSRLSHVEFFEDLLVKQLGIKVLVVGADFKFGAGRLGNIDYLKSACEKFSIDFQPLFPVLIDASEKSPQISSTRIRQSLLNEGDCQLVAKMLGRPYLVEGLIKSGDKIGRQLGFPTLNLEPERAQLLPKNGVYSAYVALPENLSAGKKVFIPPIFPDYKSLAPAAVNIGLRPTLQQNLPELRIEAHLLDRKLAMELDSRPMGIYFVERIRDEKKFADLDELKANIANDILACRQSLANHKATDFC
ncbi:MAG: riboflavin biosynthesis protein RibF [Oligoflexales bacterium]|nr:riboflavin biosynthesis protein RibF [Oligoflexales bacterium]